MDVFSILDHDEDDELLQILACISSPLNIVPDLQPPVINSEEIPVLPPKKATSRRRRTSPASLDEIQENPNENKKKKIIHRDVERERRQEMANLYSSLRALLPHQYLKGKRSVSDQIHEAVNYIQHLQKKAREMSEKRDSLKRVSSLSAINGVEQFQSYNQDLVKVRASWAGVEIILDTAINEHGLPLSTVLQVLEEEDLQIVSCIATKIKDRSFYTIESEVNGGATRDLRELQKRLTKLVLYSNGNLA